MYRHLKPGTLSYHIHHGPAKESAGDLGRYDIVITTYHTISRIWREGIKKRQEQNDIFSLTWHRVVLDEGKLSNLSLPLLTGTAHTIQNPQSQLAQACCALRSPRRWAITGTPIQNKLGDFASIVKFLQLYPYSDPTTFRDEIFGPWQDRHSTNSQGFLRLKTLVRAITISRTKAVVNLPPRVDEIHHLTFAPAEREKYMAAKKNSQVLLEAAICSGNQSGKTSNALQLLNILRLICNHGLLTQSAKRQKPSRASQDLLGVLSRKHTSHSPSADPLDEAATCSNCGGSLLEDFLQSPALAGIKAQAEGLLPSDSTICERCNFQPSFDNAENLLDSTGSSGPATPAEDDRTLTIELMSTKIKAVVADLSKHQTTEKRFSFPSVLDQLLTQAHLV